MALDSKQWVLEKLSARGGMAPKYELEAICDYDLNALDWALTSLRDAGIIAFNGHCWYVI